MNLIFQNNYHRETNRIAAKITVESRLLLCQAKFQNFKIENCRDKSKNSEDPSHLLRSGESIRRCGKPRSYKSLRTVIDAAIRPQIRSSK